MLPFEEIAVLDRNATLLGVSVRELMEAAGAAVKDEVISLGKTPVLILVGKGNNGGDGLVAGRLLFQAEIEVTICLIAGGPVTTNSRLAFERLPDGIPIKEFDQLDDCLQWAALVVDSVLGVGLRSDLRAPLNLVVDAVNRSGIPVLAVDVPTGLGTQTYFQNVEKTVTFHDIKEGMSIGCGEVVVVDIGIPADAEQLVLAGDFLLYPLPVGEIHKGQMGRVLVVGGGPYVGAPYLCAMAALRAGADLVTLASPTAVLGPILSPDLIYTSLNGNYLVPDDCSSLLSMAEAMDCLIIGPGLGWQMETMEAVKTLVANSPCPVVVDADGLRGLNPSDIQNLVGVVTPHRGELARLLGVTELPSDLEEVALNLAGPKSVIVAKGVQDIIAGNGRVKRNKTGHPRMTVGGTGDILAGLIGGIIGRGASPFAAARMGIHLNGILGEKAAVKDQFGFAASDLLPLIGETITDLVSVARGLDS